MSKIKGITVGELLEKGKKMLNLELLAGKIGLDNKIKRSEIHRPGLALVGYFDYFNFRRIQVLGKNEIAYYKKLKPSVQEERLQKIFSYKIPCFVITRDQSVPSGFKKWSARKGIPLLRTGLNTSDFIFKVNFYLEEALASRLVLPGTLVEVYGAGVLILGKSGIGKSEAALELVERGHRLIGDDAIQIHQKRDALIGRCGEIIHQHMEIRGLGIIDIKALFGARAIREQTQVEMVVKLEEWKKGKAYDRLGLKEETRQILGIKLPGLLIPVRPGRSLATIIEVGVMNYRLRQTGMHSARVLDKALQRRLQSIVQKCR